jgi:PAS domain S-box-containing protein
MSRLQQKSISFIVKYTILGFIIGTGFPILTFVFLSKTGFWSVDIIDFIFEHPSFGISLLAPFAMGGLGFVFSFYFQSVMGKAERIIRNQNEMINKITDFADKIGGGDLAATLNVRDEDQQLSKALLTMRENLRTASRREEDRNWIITGVAEVGNIIRSNDNLNSLAEQLLPYLTKRVGAIQGAFYVINDEDESNKFIEMVGSYAYNKKKHLNAKFAMGQGFVGASVLERDYVYRTEIPDSYSYVTSGLLGERKSKSLFIFPLMTDEVVYGAIEVASLDDFSPLQRDYLMELSNIIARTIYSLKVNERTVKLLRESQELSHELQERQEQLHQSAVEMQHTQEQLKKSNTKLNEQIEEVNRGQKRIHVLLENSSEVITICDKDGQVQYVSPSVYAILGYGEIDLVGTMEASRIHPRGLPDFEEMFKDLLRDQEETRMVQYSYLSKEGEYIWLEVTGKNLLDEPAVGGIVLNARDITERRNAEKESRMRSQMQSLSENSPDVICRFDKEGQLFYANPAIKHFTDKEPGDLVKKLISESGLEETIVATWEEIIQESVSSKTKVTREFEIKNGLRKLFFSVNGIPEFGENNNLESVLMVSSDITERKMAELEIQSTNKKITESINYAKRIQMAIVPDDTLVKNALPNSFVLYKPRDVISGDFPWFVKMGDDIFIAAVDCTGHGVPGALLSLIGYFILTEIVKSRKITEPGKILDLLDEGVTQTLKQDLESSETKDGMDIALCKINLKKQEVEYAGAHRPLYKMSKEGLEEFKGNKFPIGGGISRNQTEFTNYKFKVEPGDSIYFSSDGYPDQFGGPDKNRKLSPARVKDMIVQNKDNADMASVCNEFDKLFEDWRGTEKQIDDVLLIGVKF